MKSEILLEKLNSIGKSYFNSADIVKITGQTKAAVLVSLNRLVKAGRLKRLKRDFYVFISN